MICPTCQQSVTIAFGVEKCPLCGARIPTGSATTRSPVDAGASPSVVPPAAGAAGVLPSEGSKVLLIEDDLFISEIYKRNLEMAGYKVDIAMGGFEGREKVKANSYDMVLLDLMLPGVNGLDILKDIKGSDATKKTPVIIVSNLEQDEIIEQGLLLGAAKYLTKSRITPQDMVSAVNQIVGH